MANSRAYIIMAHQHPDQVVRLVRRLIGPGANIVLHVDKGAQASVYSEIVQTLAGTGGLHFLRRRSTPWGTAGVIRATLDGLRFLFDEGLPFSHVFLLTGQDYPVVPASEIASFLDRNPGKSFLEWGRFPMEDWPGGGYGRIQHYWFHTRSRSFCLRARRRLPFGLQPYGGSAQWCLARECAASILSFLRSHEALMRFFEFACNPDEIFFQTIVLNSEFRDTAVNEPLTYVDWSRPSGRGHPATLTLGDYEAIRTASCLFARKFDVRVDPSILDLIDQELLVPALAGGAGG